MAVSAELLIDNVSIVPIQSEAATGTAQAVLIRDGLIQKITAAGEIPVEHSTTVIDGTGRFLMPGLIEMHAHIPVADQGADQLVLDTLFLFVSQGITTIRGMIGDPYHLRLRGEVESGALVSPRIITSSPSLNGRTVRSVKSARRLVKFYKQQGYDFLKIHPGIRLPVMDALVETAKQQGMDFSGHVPADVGIGKALAYGYGTIDHLDGFVIGIADGDVNADKAGFFGVRYVDKANRDKMANLIRVAAKSGVSVVPTQTLFTRWAGDATAAELASDPEMQYMPRATVEEWGKRKQALQDDPLFSISQSVRLLELRNELLVELADAGVPILLGSDAPQVFNVPGFSTLHEIEAMADAGLSNSAILTAATSAPADYLARLAQQGPARYGRILVGQAADLLLLNADPSKNVSNIRKLHGVVLGGQWMNSAHIDQKLNEIAERNR